MSEPGIPNEMDVVVVGPGAAGLVYALVAAVGGLRVLVVEKSEKLGGTSAMSGGAVWCPPTIMAGPLDCPLSRGALYLILQNRISRGSGSPEIKLHRDRIDEIPC